MEYVGVLLHTLAFPLIFCRSHHASPFILNQSLQVNSTTVIDFSFDDLELSVDLGTFLGETAKNLFGDDVPRLDELFADLTDLLDTIASYGPNITVGDPNIPTEIEGLFDIIADAKDFADGLQEFVRFVGNGEKLLTLYIHLCLASY